MANKVNMKIFVAFIITILLMACGQRVEMETSTEPAEELVTLDEDTPIEAKATNQRTFLDVLQEIPPKDFPLIEETSFDNVEEGNDFNLEDIALLQLTEIYPNSAKEGYEFRIMPAYTLKLSRNFYTVVLHVFKNNQELESVLINYSLDETIISYKVVAYDEIAEGWSRVFSRIDGNSIAIIDKFYGNEETTETTLFRINEDGYFQEEVLELESSLRSKETLFLLETYTDTLNFQSYNDDGDYFILHCKKEDLDVFFVYGWDRYTNEKYSFRMNDLIEVQWKMDRVWRMDDESIVFMERAVDASKF